jgi:hypothetical protein
MDNQTKQKQNALGELHDLITKVDKRVNPFVYYLPEIITKSQLTGIDPNQALLFSQIALKHDRLPLVMDALKILNRLVNPDDGSLIIPTKTFFYDNRNFFWDELGNNTKTTDIISHIFNRTIFIIKVGKNT